MDEALLHSSMGGQLASQAGSTDLIRAENVLAREILLVETTLATMLEESHPAKVIFIATVKRLTRRLVILEESLNVEKDQLSRLYQKRMNLFEIEGGSLPSTREL